MASWEVMPKLERASIASRMPAFRLYASLMRSAFSRLMPGICERRSGSFSKTLSVSSPNASTSRRAVARPIPLTAPEDKYCRIAWAVLGCMSA